MKIYKKRLDLVHQRVQNIVQAISGSGHRRDWTVKMVKEYQELFRKGTPKGPYLEEEAFNLYR